MLLSVLGRDLGLGGESVLTSPLPVCLSDGGHARPCDPSDLIRCRKYVKSQKARGVQAYQYTQDTSTQRSTMRKQGSDDKEKPRGGRPLVFFSHPWLFIG